MMLTDYPGLVPEMYMDLGPRIRDYDQSWNAAMWPSDSRLAYFELAEMPPYSIQIMGNAGQQVSPGSMPAFLTPESPNITGWQDLSVTEGYPTPAGTAPFCNQILPLVNNWAGAYMPPGQSSLTAWLAQNPVEAMLLGLVVMAVGAVASRSL